MASAGRFSGGDHRWQLPLRALLLAAALLLPIVLMGRKSATFDEVVHLPAGYSYLATRAVQINPQHPPLIKELCALPLLFMDVKMPVDPETLRKTAVSLIYQWKFGKNFLYRQNADLLLFWGRIPAVLLSLGLAVLVMIWAGRLFGGGAALLALLLYVFDPTITAHAQLVTTDVGLAFFATLFLFAYRRYLERKTGRRLVLAGLALGLALGAKFSAVILLPVAAVLAVLAESLPPPAVLDAVPKKGKGARPAKGSAPARTPRREEGKGRRILEALGGVGIMAAVGFALVWALYFFPSDPLFYLKGLQSVNRDHDPNYFPYLMGELKPGGWRLYLLIAWLVKTPLPSLLLLAASVVLYFKGRRAERLDEAFLIVPALAFFVGYSLTADNLGVRYLIPCFPFFFIFTSRLAPFAAAGKAWIKGALAVALIWFVAEYAAIWPDHLSYFNEITGIPPRGSEWLDDSNLDWGQGLIQLRDYLAEHPPPGDFRFCYFGSGEPAYYGIRGPNIAIDTLARPPASGTYILSAHCVARARAELFELHGNGAENWLAHRAPDAEVGHAYYIYRIQ